jgi:hypothetical protein
MGWPEAIYSCVRYCATCWLFSFVFVYVVAPIVRSQLWRRDHT